MLLLNRATRSFGITGGTSLTSIGSRPQRNRPLLGRLLVNLPSVRLAQGTGEPAYRGRGSAASVTAVAGLPGDVLEAVRKLGLEGSSGIGSIPATNPANDRALGSSSARTWTRSSFSGGLHSRCAWVRCRCANAFAAERLLNLSLASQAWLSALALLLQRLPRAINSI